MFQKLLEWLRSFCVVKKAEVQKVEPPKIVRKKVDTPAIRARITAQGWKLLEVPIKKNSPVPEERVVIRWKIVATKGDRSIESGGITIDEAMRNTGVFLGVVPK